MNSIADQIKSGSRAFLKTEYYYLCYYVAVVFCALLVLYSLVPPSGDRTDGIRYACCFLVGAGLSASSGWAGMMVATDANVKTTQAALDKGLPVALRVAFTGGSVMGFTVVGLGLLGLSLMYFFVTFGYGDETLYQRLNWAADILAGFGFGASSIAIFARVAGGIYTKAADVGADLVGKVEMDIPEDDPRNPAVIADNVGDNVGDVAGMGADLFESYVRVGFADTSFFRLWQCSHHISTACSRFLAVGWIDYCSCYSRGIRYRTNHVAVLGIWCRDYRKHNWILRCQDEGRCSSARLDDRPTQGCDRVVYFCRWILGANCRIYFPRTSRRWLEDLRLCCHWLGCRNFDWPSH